MGALVPSSSDDAIVVDPTTEVVDPLNIRIPLELELLCLSDMDHADSMAHAPVLFHSSIDRGVGIRGTEIVPTVTAQMIAARKLLQGRVAQGDAPEITQKRTLELTDWVITFRLLPDGTVEKHYQSTIGAHLLTLSPNGELVFQSAPSSIFLIGDPEVEEEDSVKLIARLFAEFGEKTRDPETL